MTRHLLIRGVGIRVDNGAECMSPTKAARFGFLQMGSRPSGSRWLEILSFICLQCSHDQQPLRHE